MKKSELRYIIKEEIMNEIMSKDERRWLGRIEDKVKDLKPEKKTNYTVHKVYFKDGSFALLNPNPSQLRDRIEIEGDGSSTASYLKKFVLNTSVSISTIVNVLADY